MKLMRTEDAVGQVLCHDITQIIKGVTKDAVFRKGHIITEEDIPVLLSVGKDHIYIWENNENMLHENDAAKILYDMCANEHMTPSEIKEGKIELIARKEAHRRMRQSGNALSFGISPRSANILSMFFSFNLSMTRCTSSLVDDTHVRCARLVTPKSSLI